MNLNNNDTEIPEYQLEEQALQLDAKDFACLSTAKAKPQRREPAGSSPRTVPIGKRTWTDIEPGKYSLSEYEVSKKVIHLLRHSQKVHREEDGIHSHNLFIGLTIDGKHVWQQEEGKKSSFVLMIQEQLFFSELFKDIQDAILLILLYRTMLLFRSISSNIFTMSDVQSIYIPSSTLD